MTKKVLTACIAVAALTGIAAGVVSSVFIIRFSASLPLLKGVRVSADDTAGEIVIRDPRKVIVEEDVQLGVVSESMRASTAKFFPFKKSSESPLADAYTAAEYITQGAVITSDGWVAVAHPAGIRAGTTVALVGGDLFAVERVVADQRSGIAFVKVQASGLKVLPYADRTLLRPGQRAIAAGGYAGSTVLRSLAQVYQPASADRAAMVRSSEGIDTFISLDSDLADAYEGSPVLTIDGQLAGILIDPAQGRVLAGSYVSAAGDAVLRTGAVSLPYLGVRYLNTAQVPGALRSGVRGAYLLANKGAAAVASNSPLQGIAAAGDVISAVEGQSIDEYRDLQDALRAYRAGSEITITIVSKGQSRNIKLTLGK